MITHYKSHSLSILAEQLANIMDENLPEDPLMMRQVIVPNLDTSRWLKLNLAERNGMAANIEFILPSDWQWRQVRKLMPELPKNLPSDQGPMKWAIFELLLDQATRKKFGILDSYISSQGDEYIEQRALSIANQMAWLFDQYQVYRPELIIAWQNGRKGEGDEKWQSALWKLFDKTIKNRVGDHAKFNRAELFLKISEAVKNGDIEFDQPLYMFNPGLIPKSIVELFKEAGKRTDSTLFQIQPSKQADQFQNELLQSFGDEAARTSTLWKGDDTDEQSRFSSITLSSDLDHIRDSIIRNEPLTIHQYSVKTLEGIHVRSCHSPVREIETLHQFLIEQFEKDETLHPDDVLVVTPNLENYRSAIHAVFGSTDEGVPQIPYHCDNQGSGEYALQRSFLKLLSLIDSRFTFSEVMDFLAMKSVRDKFGLSEPDADMIRGWMKDNHVVWGLDAEHRTDWEQPAESLQTWHEALKRGWLGQWVDSGEDRLLNNTLLFAGVHTTNQKKIWSSFSKFLSLMGEYSKLAQNHRSCAQWCEVLKHWIESLFSEHARSSHEGIKLKNILDTMEESCNLVKFEGYISFTEFRSELISAVEKKSIGSSSANFNRGIVFSSMVPVRSIPAKIIALIGLNEETFPRKPSAPEFDLIAQKPANHDRNRKEEDRNLFLESILAAKNIHYCSYIGQSSIDNETIPPSPILGEWVDILAGYTGVDPDEIIKKEPLNGFSISQFQSKESYSQAYFKTAQSIVKDGNKTDGLRLSGKLPVPDEDETINISDFVRFFGSPVQWFVGNRFNARLLEPEADKDEFEMDSLEEHILFQRVFGWVQKGLTQPQMEKILEQSGALPSGWAGQRQLQEIIQHVYTSINLLKDHNFEPEITQVDFSFQVEDVLFEGALTSYSKNHLLDITPSSMSGKLALQAWLKHLIRSVQHNDQNISYLCCELKKGDPKLFQFQAVSEPKSMLRPFVELYKSGRTKPLHFFPKTIYAFWEEEKKGSEKAFQKAAEKFEGGFNTYGERENEYIKVLMGEDVEFRDEFVEENFLELIREMAKHMESLK